MGDELGKEGRAGLLPRAPGAALSENLHKLIKFHHSALANFGYRKPTAKHYTCVTQIPEDS